MLAEFLCRIMGLSLLLHLRVRDEESAELPKELSALSAELRLREVPGKSVQRSRWRRRLRLVEGLELQHSSRAPVLWVSRPPPGLLHPLARGLAVGLRARPLPRADSGVWSKPLSAEATRARPVEHHSGVARRRDATTSPPSLSLSSLTRRSRLRRFAPRRTGHFWRADPVHFSRAPKSRHASCTGLTLRATCATC